MTNITRKTKETKVAMLIGAGDPLPFVHTCNQTLMSAEKLSRELPLPDNLATLATNAPNAEVVAFKDHTLGIEIDGHLWAVEQPHEERGCLRGLPHECWQYLNLAMGRKAEGISFGDTSSIA